MHGTAVEIKTLYLRQLNFNIRATFVWTEANNI